MMARAGQGDALDRVWGVVRTPALEQSGQACRAMAAALGGLVVVDGDVSRVSPPWDAARVTAVAVPAGAADGACLAAAIRVLPPSASAVAWCPDLPVSAEKLVDLVAELDGVDAVVTASPVTDAVKQVRDGRILRGVPRDGLCRPRPPLVVTAATALGMLRGLDAARDPIGALSACRATVRTVTVDDGGA